ncbi:MAG: alpha-(1-_3)-arabinofuranosyltransferase family protein, partial [Ilumatobacteraceae bacterium]
MTAVSMRRLLDHVDRAGIALLALLAYVPTMLSSPGTMPADTKAYLYLDPGRLTTDAPWTFDPRQFAGWVPHQHITYLWPSGPWYWFWDKVGAPDWLAHRLWLGTIFLIAGLGVRWLARHLGLGPAAGLVAALVYQLSPYVLPYVSRTSLMLLPWAGLGWIVALTIRAATRSSWRDAGVLALVIATVGSPNATALAMIAPAPVLWLVHAAWGQLITWRRAAITTVKVGVLSVGVSLWWIAMLMVQGRHGADVLGYSESLEAVSQSSVSSEVLRGLGYWLFYLRDAYAPTTTAASDYMTNEALILAGFTVLVAGVAGLALTSWRHRRFALWSFAAGTRLAVGVQRHRDPNPAVSALVGDTESGLALALRSSTRALPMATLGLALGAGARRCRPPAAQLAPDGGPRARRRGGDRQHAVAVAPRLRRSGAGARRGPAEAWDQATAALDAGDDDYRVLELPGQEFGAYRWGYTVDQPLPGLTERAIVTRDLLPLGSPMAMDLLFALDDRFQEGIAEPGAVAPVSRLLGADTIWVPGDAAFDRFRTPRPEQSSAFYADTPPGLGEPVPYGEPAVNEPDIDMVDEQSVTDALVGRPVAPVELVPVEDPLPVVRTKTGLTLVAGSGDGIVDAAAAGLIDGTELLRYSADMSGGALRDAIGGADALVVTDSNRDRAHRWASSQDAVGFTESGGPGNDLLRVESADARLPVFTNTDPDRSTIATQRGPVTAVATAYGEPFAYRPEHRAAMAIDGDTTTAWLVADRFDASGERIVLTTDAGIDHIRFVQPRFAQRQRHLTAIDVRIDDGPSQ